MGHIYISYSHRDQGAAQRLAESLRAKGYQVWFDGESHIGGSDWRAKATSAVTEADAFVALLSPAASASRWAGEELSLALKAQRPIVPVILEPTPLPESLINRQFVDASKNWDQAVEQIILALEANIGLAQARQQQPVTTATAPAAAPVRKTSTVRLLVIGLIAIVVVGLAILVLSSNNSIQGTANHLPTPFSQVTPAVETPGPGVTASPPESVAAQWTMTSQAVQLTVSALTGGELQTSAAQLTITQMPFPTPGPATPTARGTPIQSINAVNLTATALVGLFPSTTAQASSPGTPGPTLPNTGGGAPGPGLDDVNDIVAATVVAIRATDDSSLSPQEAAILLNRDNSGSSTAIWITGILAALSLGGTIGTLVIVLTGRGSRRRTGHPAAHHSQPPQNAEAAGPAPLEEYQIFISSSDKDKDWVTTLVEDLNALDYLVWWYVKDAPGLPFGNEIRGAIFHAKVLVIIVSSASMKSKHIEEEIRWAEIYDRPIIPVLFEPVDVQERLYGLAKGADIDFTNDRNYKQSIELLTQAIDHYLKQRLQAIQGDTNGANKK